MQNYKPEGKLFKTKKNQEYLRDAAGLRQAFADGAILEAIATSCDCNHNLIVDLGGIRGMIPRQEGALGIAEGETRDIALIAKTGKPVCFKITAFGSDFTGRELVYLSRRAVQQECYEQYISLLRCGDIIAARVTHLDTFGCFADIGCGISSLIPIDSISVSRISHPCDRFENHMDILAVVKAKDDKGRVLLSHKELLGTWEQNAAIFTAGETVQGIIRSVEDYGIFVELTPNLAGLAEPKENARPGQLASVYIKSLIPEKMKIKLILVDCFDADTDLYLPSRLQYFVQDTDHMDRWIYSPAECSKVIETVFENEAYALAD